MNTKIHTLAHMAVIVLLTRIKDNSIEYGWLHNEAIIIQKYARRRIYRLIGLKIAINRIKSEIERRNQIQKYIQLFHIAILISSIFRQIILFISSC